MEPNEYARMHALETDYWWFVGRRAIIASLLHDVRRGGRAFRKGDPPFQLLDIGCGTGANLPMLSAVASGNSRVTGLDYSPLALEFARNELGDLPVCLLRGDALNLPFASDKYDAVTMLDVLEHLSNDTRALQQVHRVLRPGGAYVFSVPAYQHLWSAHDEALHHFRRYEIAGLRQLLRDQGFAIERISFAMSLMPPAAWLWRRFILPFKPKRPNDAKRHSEGAVLPTLPPFANRAFVKYLEYEGKLITKRPLRFGTSIVGIARKKG